jgi:hypothetical protein
MKHARPSHDVKPAVPIIRAATERNGGGNSPVMLVHSWSNGGAAMLAHIRAAFHDRLPPHVTIFDSGPGLWTHDHGRKGFTLGMPLSVKVLAYPILTVVSMIYVLWYTGRLHPYSRWYYSQNQGEGEASRTYIFSDSDTLIHHKFIEGHARDAQDKGFTVRTEKFDMTPHVGHIRGDEDRYWDIVKTSWKL